MTTAFETGSLPVAPAVPGLVIRHYRGAVDHPGMARVATASAADGGFLEVVTAASLDAQYAHLRNCDPERDIAIVELAGDLVAYARLEWADRSTGERGFETICKVDPAVRGKGIGHALLAWQERRAMAIAASWAELDRAVILAAYVNGNDGRGRTLVERHGFALTRRHAELARPDFDAIPDPALPDGFEVRPIDPDDEALVRRVFEVDVEVFSEHWGDRPDTSDSGFARFREDPTFDPRLWRVAFDGDEIAGQILNYLAEPEADGTRVGWTESIAVRRPYRRRGLARALLAESIRAVRDAGATSAALSVDEANPNQAMALYESLGFRLTGELLEFHRPLPGGPDR